MKWALIKSGKVYNVIIAEQVFINHLLSSPNPPDAAIMIEGREDIHLCFIGSVWDGNAFSLPEIQA